MLNIPWWNVDLGPKATEAVAETVRDRCLSMGKITARFEERMAERLGVPYVVAVNSGTNALMLALLEAGVGPGCEVIVPDRTWIATANAAHLLGARVVLVEVEEKHPLMDVDAFAAAITPATRAVIPVHLNGHQCHMPRIRELAEKNGIRVIEDACQGLFSLSHEGGYLGTHSRAGCFSLSVTKLITSGQGGFVVTHNGAVAQRLRQMRTQGTGDIIEAQWLSAGGNFRYTDVHAALALTQMDRLEERKQAIQNTFHYYSEAIKDNAHVRLMREYAPGALPLYPEVLCSRRADLLAHLAQKGIEVRKTYPSLYKAPQFAAHNAPLPRADRWEAEAFFLPCGPDRSTEELAYVAEAIKQWQERQVS